MGEDLEADGRMAVRTPMQWAAAANGGFSTAPRRRVIRRITEGAYGPEHVSVSAQLHDPDSLWSWMRTLIAIRRSCPEIGWGTMTVLEHDADEAVLAHRVEVPESAVVAVHNLSSEARTVSIRVDPLEVHADDPEVSDLLSRAEVAVEDGRLQVVLDGYGVRWLRLRPPGQLSIP